MILERWWTGWHMQFLEYCGILWNILVYEITILTCATQRSVNVHLLNRANLDDIIWEGILCGWKNRRVGRVSKSYGSWYFCGFYLPLKMLCPYCHIWVVSQFFFPGCALYPLSYASCKLCCMVWTGSWSLKLDIYRG